MTQEARVQEFVSAFNALRAEVEKVIVGQREIVTHVLIGMFAGGHVLLEGVPGLGKTLLIKTLAEGLELSFARVQFTPDLMPADIIGTNIIVEDADGRKHFQFQSGPIFAHILLADTINHTTHVRAIHFERVMTCPNARAFRELVREFSIATHVRDFASAIVMATHPQWAQAPDATRRFVRFGASPRGAQALVLGAKVKALADGRYNVSVEDLKALAAPALRHRIILNFEGEAEAVDVDALVGDIVEGVERQIAQDKEPFLR